MRRLLFSLPFFAVACSASDDAVVSGAGIRLERLWTAEGFADPEGVAPAPDGGYFISNVAGGGDAKDGEGWITILSADGEILVERFADGLDAPKGMAVLDDVLYVADIDLIRRYDVRSGAAHEPIAVDGALMLNDGTVWGGAVYFSDSRAGKIYRIDGQSASLWSSDERLAGANGLLGDGDVLYVTTMSRGSLLAATSDGAMTEIASGMINADGVGLVPGGGWLVSCWPGEIHYVSPDGAATRLLDTAKKPILQNDLTVYGDRVIVPNWTPGTVTAWRIVR